jgi:hypothetical protein
MISFTPGQTRRDPKEDMPMALTTLDPNSTLIVDLLPTRSA